MNVFPRHRLEKCHRALLAEGDRATGGPSSPEVRAAWLSVFGLPMPPPEMAAAVLMFPAAEGHPGEWWHHDGKFAELKYKLVKWDRTGRWGIYRLELRRSGWSLSPRDLKIHAPRQGLALGPRPSLPLYRTELGHRACVWEGSNVLVSRGPEDVEVDLAHREFFGSPLLPPERAEVVATFPTGDVSRGEWWYRVALDAPDLVGGDSRDVFRVVKWDLLDLEKMRGDAKLYELEIRRGAWSSDRPAGMGG